MLNRERIFEYAFNKYGTKPEYLWKKTPDAAVLRHSGSRKWYALVMFVRPDKLGLKGDMPKDVLNIKCDPIMIGSLLEKNGYIRAYHMNKDKWISVILEKVSDDEVYRLIDLSFGLTS